MGQVPPYIQERATNLWLALMETSDDPLEVIRLLEGESADTPQQFLQVLYSANVLWWCHSWPQLVAQFERVGVKRDDMRTGIADGLIQDFERHLREQVEVGDAQ